MVKDYLTLVACLASSCGNTPHLTAIHQHLLPGDKRLAPWSLYVCDGRNAKDTKEDVIRRGKKEKQQGEQSKELDRCVLARGCPAGKLYSPIPEVLFCGSGAIIPVMCL